MCHFCLFTGFWLANVLIWRDVKSPPLARMHSTPPNSLHMWLNVDKMLFVFLRKYRLCVDLFFYTFSSWQREENKVLQIWGFFFVPPRLFSHIWSGVRSPKHHWRTIRMRFHHHCWWNPIATKKWTPWSGLKRFPSRQCIHFLYQFLECFFAKYPSMA